MVPERGMAGPRITPALRQSRIPKITVLSRRGMRGSGVPQGHVEGHHPIRSRPPLWAARASSGVLTSSSFLVKGLLDLARERLQVRCEGHENDIADSLR